VLLGKKLSAWSYAELASISVGKPGSGIDTALQQIAAAFLNGRESKLQKSCTTKKPSSFSFFRDLFGAKKRDVPLDEASKQRAKGLRLLGGEKEAQTVLRSLSNRGSACLHCRKGSLNRPPP
jgi:hypothetical protein